MMGCVTKVENKQIQPTDRLIEYEGYGMVLITDKAIVMMKDTTIETHSGTHGTIVARVLYVFNDYVKKDKVIRDTVLPFKGNDSLIKFIKLHKFDWKNSDTIIVSEKIK
jgi:hypothetical protein